MPPGAAIAVLARRASSRSRRCPARLAALAAAAALLLAGLRLDRRPATPSSSRRRRRSRDWARVVGGDALVGPPDPAAEHRPARVRAAAGRRRRRRAARRSCSRTATASTAGWTRSCRRRAASRKVVDLGAERPGQARASDPHWWHDPRNAEAAVAAIRDALVARRPEGRATFRRNAEAYLRSACARSTASIAACFAHVPRRERKLVTDHDAFDYFARRYGITVVGAVIPSQTTQAQPSAGETARLIRLVRREHVRAIFPESSLNPRLAQTIARATGASARLHAVRRHARAEARAARRTSDGAANADAMVRGFTGGRRGCAID